MRVARAMHSSPQGLAANLIGERELEACLQERLTGVPNLRPDRAARALIKQLRGRNFMICSVGANAYAFVHRTFLEFFCAAEIRERFEAEQSLTLDDLKRDIFGHWNDETWHEVLRLLAGMISPQFVGEILEWLLEQRDPEWTCRNIFLGAGCVGEVRNRSLLGAAEARVRGHVMALTRFDFPYYYEPYGPEAEKADSVRANAVSTAATVWFNSAEVHDWLKDRSRTDEFWLVRQTAVQELARGWKDDPETLPIVKDRARTDEIFAVRRTAVQELARGWKDDPETLPIVKDRARTDENYAVRRTAVQELARGWKGDPETLVILQERARSDEDNDVRETAVQELARGWKDDASVQAFLKSLESRGRRSRK